MSIQIRVIKVSFGCNPWKKKYKDVFWPAVELFRCRPLSRATKIVLYKILIRPVVTCGAEAWTVTKREEKLC